MGKQRKRRHKVYSGEDAKLSQPSIKRYVAVDRSPLGQWWYERKLVVKRVALYGGGGAVAIFLIFEAIRSIF